MIKDLNPAGLASALRGGFSYLELNRALLDRLNVFPVPDGDTGANMASTLASGIETLNESDMTMEELGIGFNKELNRCSRGNSGFILARFFHGFFETISSRNVLTASIFAKAVANGSFHVNGSLFSPVEGTMISLLSAAAAALTGYKEKNISSALKLTVDTGTKALFLTPKQLPVLARAGVVDSGALGLLFIFKGMYAAITGKQSVKEIETEYRFEPNPEAGDTIEEAPAYRFCTEAVVIRNNVIDEDLNDWLKTIGNSIALVDEEHLLKIHIHTDNPQTVFERLEKLGDLDHTKVDDMQEQTRLVSADTNAGDGMAILSFVPGEGFERIFEDQGVSNCFIYTETLPSPEEIAETLKTIVSEQIIVMPNNSNILPSVMAVRDITDKKISIVPTKNVIQGITATYGFSADDNVKDNVDSMTDFMNDAIALYVYKSTMDTRFGNIELKIGDWFVTRSDEVLGVGICAADAVLTAVKQIATPDITEAAVYHGNGFDPRDLNEVVGTIITALPGINVEDHFGGQSREALIISLE